ncbi:ABC transporter ATP-binding protein [Fundicoccus sp. Sow4_H7]|uniref:ABC transporter ATP-binding protein n=1 Tax=Fundicoccus sp. Sow4_H7 TaxID=3438784 RepID=UPI003F8DEBDD
MRGVNNRALDKEIQASPPEINRVLLERIFSYIRPYLWQLLVIIAIILFSSVLGIFPSVLSGKIIDEGFIAEDFDRLVVLIALSVGVLFASSLISLMQVYLSAWLSQNIAKDLRNQMYAHLQKMPQSFFTSRKQGEIVTRMTSDIAGVESVITGTFTQTISNVAVLLTSIVVMFRMNWILAVVSLLVVPLLVIPIKLVGKKRWALTTETQQMNDQANEVVNETLSVSGQQLVKLFTKEESEHKRFGKINDDLSALKIKERTLGSFFRMVAFTLVELGPMVLYLIGGFLILKRGHTNLTIGDITIMVSLMMRLYRPLMNLLDVQIEFVRSLALFTRIFDYLDLSVEIEEVENPIVIDDFKGNLTFNDVYFDYQPNKPIIKGVSFSVEAGKTLAIVGHSGAGKSTLFNLIPRLYDSKGGDIYLDGVSIKDLDLEFLRQQIGMVTQETYLFNASIKENLLYAKADATDTELVEACRAANIHDFIMSLPDGYETVVGNRGTKLSGGEKQRVSIARVILKNPKILLLDEATSSLDSISEQLIQEALEPLMKERTTLVIAHRLSTIMNADEILVLDKGRVAEVGTHLELLEQDSLYKQMYQTQFKTFLESEEFYESLLADV